MRENPARERECPWLRPSVKHLLGASQVSLEVAASSLGLAPPEPGTLLVEVPALPCTPVSNLQHLHDDVIALPAALPQLRDR